MWDDPFGLVFIGGDLEPDSLLEAYRRGIFPWFNEDDPLLWWSPDPRAIFEIDAVHVSRRLQRIIRQQRFTVTINQDFPQVMHACSQREEGTWITSDMFAAYCKLHELGFAHSVEAWDHGVLAGGIYGVALGGFFAAESMFHSVSNAGMVAFAALVDRLRERGFHMFDTQIATDHTRQLGAIDIPRTAYLQRLESALNVRTRFDDR
ncbi:MAG: leucyl/phenylalanyl-tRNA--protein transferase [Planctomycetia bacterium]|nr:leucyl/phenylalanyl-tRNA--protein transferase [Planctomycetia bacterium]